MKALWTKVPNVAKVGLLLMLAFTAASTVMTARRDLARRDPASIRGKPEVWDKVTRMPGGATAYLLAGRRATA